MNQEIENLDRVKKRINHSGFGPEFNNEIDERIAAGETRFQLLKEFSHEGKTLTCLPEINIHEQKAYYNGFSATLTFEDQDRKPVKQWFPSADRITVEEAYTLLIDPQRPRAVCKQYMGDDNNLYNTWLQIDFASKTRNDNHVVNRYGDFDLMSKLRDYAFQGLERNYRTAVSFLKQGKELELEPQNNEKYSQVRVIANPARATLTIMDVKGNVLEHDQFRTQHALDRIKTQESEKVQPAIQRSTISFVKNSEQETGKAEDLGNVDAETSETQEQFSEKKSKPSRAIRSDKKPSAKLNRS